MKATLSTHAVASLAAASVALATLFGATAAQGVTILPAPDSFSASSEFPGGGYPVSGLFTEVVTVADLGVTSYGGGAEGGGSQWAALGAGPHNVFMDFGSTVSADGVAYAQRGGNDPTFDKVGLIEFWFSDTPFGGVLPDTGPDASATITHLADKVIQSYDLSGGLYSGQYVAARFTVDVGSNGNIGGSEMRLTRVPEPSCLVLGLLAVIGLPLVARKRFRN